MITANILSLYSSRFEASGKKSLSVTLESFQHHCKLKRGRAGLRAAFILMILKTLVLLKALDDDLDVQSWTRVSEILKHYEDHCTFQACLFSALSRVGRIYLFLTYVGVETI